MKVLRIVFGALLAMSLPISAQQAPARSPSLGIPGAQQESFSLRGDYERLGLKPKTQGKSECTLHATLDVLEFDYAKAGQPVALSATFAKWVRSPGKPWADYTHLISGIQKYGLCREELMPSTGEDIAPTPSPAAFSDAANRRNVRVLYFATNRSRKTQFGFSDEEIRKICLSIKEGLPVACGVTWPTTAAANFGRRNEYTLDTVIFPTTAPGHSVVLTGYEIGERWEGRGRMQFRNSHGEKWGDAGYGWLTFGYLKKNGEAAWAIHKR